MSRWVFEFPFIYAVNMTILATCALAVGVNVSQFMCLGRFTAVAYQVLSHTKTICVLLGGALLFGEVITPRIAVGMSMAVLGAPPTAAAHRCRCRCRCCRQRCLEASQPPAGNAVAAEMATHGGQRMQTCSSADRQPEVPVVRANDCADDASDAAASLLPAAAARMLPSSATLLTGRATSDDWSAGMIGYGYFSQKEKAPATAPAASAAASKEEMQPLKSEAEAAAPAKSLASPTSRA